MRKRSRGCSIARRMRYSDTPLKLGLQQKQRVWEKSKDMRELFEKTDAERKAEEMFMEKRGELFKKTGGAAGREKDGDGDDFFDDDEAADGAAKVPKTRGRRGSTQRDRVTLVSRMRVVAVH